MDKKKKPTPKKPFKTKSPWRKQMVNLKGSLQRSIKSGFVPR